MSMHIVGFDARHRQEAEAKAIEAGIALQLTNILRDVGEDLQRQRLYLPRQDLQQQGCDPETPSQWQASAGFREVLRLNISRARRCYDCGREGLRYLDPRGRLAVSAALSIYEAILRDIEAHGYDVLGRRAYVSLAGKLATLPAAAWVAFKV
jgi:phytoene synthase